jgi:hypothetical protein
MCQLPYLQVVITDACRLLPSVLGASFKDILPAEDVLDGNKCLVAQIAVSSPLKARPSGETLGVDTDLFRSER